MLSSGLGHLVATDPDRVVTRVLRAVAPATKVDLAPQPRPALIAVHADSHGTWRPAPTPPGRPATCRRAIDGQPEWRPCILPAGHTPGCLPAPADRALAVR